MGSTRTELVKKLEDGDEPEDDELFVDPPDDLPADKPTEDPEDTRRQD